MSAERFAFFLTDRGSDFGASTGAFAAAIGAGGAAGLGATGAAAGFGAAACGTTGAAAGFGATGATEGSFAAVGSFAAAGAALAGGFVASGRGGTATGGIDDFRTVAGPGEEGGRGSVPPREIIGDAFAGGELAGDDTGLGNGPGAGFGNAGGVATGGRGPTT